MFTRQDVCALTGIPVERFKSLARRNQLPTVYVPPRGAPEDCQDRAKERGWNWFSPIDVLLIAVQERLTAQIGYADGSDPRTAANVVVNNAGDIGRIYWLASSTIGDASQDDLWVGYVGHADRLDDGSGCSHVGGSLARIMETIGDDTAREGRRLVLVNVSAVLRDVRTNADRANIMFPVPSDWK